MCAALPRGDPNHVTDDFIAHLTMEHKSQSIRDFISFVQFFYFASRANILKLGFILGSGLEKDVLACEV